MKNYFQKIAKKDLTKRSLVPILALDMVIIHKKVFRFIGGRRAHSFTISGLAGAGEDGGYMKEVNNPKSGTIRLSDGTQAFLYYDGKISLPNRTKHREFIHNGVKYVFLKNSLRDRAGCAYTGRNRRIFVPVEENNTD